MEKFGERIDIGEYNRVEIAPIDRLLSDQEKIAELMRFRKSDQEETRVLSSDLRKVLTDVYLVFEPVAMRMLEPRLRLFFNLDCETVNDIFATRKLKLWDVVVRLFDWEVYEGNSDMAVGAFIKYLQRSNGSFFAQDIIRDQKTTSLGGFGKRKNAERQIRRPVEDEVIMIEQRDIFGLLGLVGDKLTIFEEIFYEGKTVAEMGEMRGVSEPTMKAGIIKEKKCLYKRAVKLGIIEVGEMRGLSSAIQFEEDSRSEKLEGRRQALLLKFPMFIEILTYMPQTREVLTVFYGLNGENPVYSYEETARITGLSLEFVRVQVPYGVRLLLGKEKVSDKILKMIGEKRLYLWGMENLGELGLSEMSLKVLDLYYGKNLTDSDIASQLGFSKETARRERVKALNKIRLSHNVLIEEREQRS